jgi:hypothetical protein
MLFDVRKTEIALIARLEKRLLNTSCKDYITADNG